MTTASAQPKIVDATRREFLAMLAAGLLAASDGRATDAATHRVKRAFGSVEVPVPVEPARLFVAAALRRAQRGQSRARGDDRTLAAESCDGVPVGAQPALRARSAPAEDHRRARGVTDRGDPVMTTLLDRLAAAVDGDPTTEVPA